MESLERVLNLLDCGVAKLVFDGERRRVEWANAAFYALTGSSASDYADESGGGNPRHVLHPEDYDWVMGAYAGHVHKTTPLTLQYRVLHRDGHVVWLDVIANFTGCQDGKVSFINIIRDITQLKEMQRQRDYEFRRYQLLCDLSSDLLFEYDTDKDLLTNYSSSTRNFQLTRIENFLSRPQEHNMLTEEGVSEVRRLFWEDVVAGKECRRSRPIQIRTRDGLRWFTVTCGIVGHVIIGKLSDVSEDVALVHGLRQKALHDGLTGLLNKKTFVEQAQRFFLQARLPEKLCRLAGPDDAGSEFGSAADSESREMWDGQSHALVIVDIDKFKAVNDSFGHSVGDVILRTVAACLREHFRHDDIKGRFGGDEFVLMLRNVAAPVATRLVDRCRASITRACQAHAASHTITCSAGLSIFPEHGESFDELFDKADCALYAAKNRGRNQTVCFAEGIPASAGSASCQAAEMQGRGTEPEPDPAPDSPAVS